MKQFCDQDCLLKFYCQQNEPIMVTQKGPENSSIGTNCVSADENKYQESEVHSIFIAVIKPDCYILIIRFTNVVIRCDTFIYIHIIVYIFSFVGVELQAPKFGVGDGLS